METPKIITQQQIIEQLPQALSALSDNDRSAVLAHVHGALESGVTTDENPIAFETAIRGHIATLAQRAIKELLIPTATNGQRRDLDRLYYQLRDVFPKATPRE